MIVYEALGRGSATSFLGFEPEDIYCFSRSGRGIFAMTWPPLLDKAEAGSVLVECWELTRGMTSVCIRFEGEIVLPPAHCLKCVQLRRLRCIELHLCSCYVVVLDRRWN